MAAVLVERQVTEWVIEYLAARSLLAASLLEEETGVQALPPELAFLRRLTAHGRWADTLEYARPLAQAARCTPALLRSVEFVVRRQQLLELLAPAEPPTLAAADVDQVDGSAALRACLAALEGCAPSRDEYVALCQLLPLPSPAAHADYRLWTVAAGRAAVYQSLAAPLQCLLRAETPPPTVAIPQFDRPRPTAPAHSCTLTRLLWRGLVHRDTPVPADLPFQPLAASEQPAEPQRRRWQRPTDATSWLVDGTANKKNKRTEMK